MDKGFDWWDWNITSEIYLNTERSDWWRACKTLARLMAQAKTIIDIGGGDGHTLWQILSVAKKNGSRIKKVTFIEPSRSALRLAGKRLKQLSIPSLELIKGTLETVGSKIVNTTKKPYDCLYAGHVNYYFGKQSGGKYNLQRYYESLELLPKIARTVIIMTAPQNSDYYKVVLHNPFTKHAYSEAVTAFYRSRKYKVRIIKTPVRFYVNHALESPEEAVVLWKFFNDTERMPNNSEIKKFIKKLSIRKDRSGHINFKDQLLIISKILT